MANSISEFLAPSYFVSYSHKQEKLVLRLKQILRHGARTVWYDRDHIVVGDKWADEIRDGVRNADELVLFLSEQSIASKYVEAEVRYAREGGKLVCPILLEDVSHLIPSNLSDIQYLDLHELDEHEQNLRFAYYFGAREDEAEPDSALKLRACRSVWPPCSMALLDGAGRLKAQDYATELSRLAPHYAMSSSVRLNAGLTHCLAGNWDDGLRFLRDYARAANSFPGWLFLALHLPRRAPVGGAPLACVKEALTAISNALAIAPHPLAILAAAILETGGDNRGDRNCAHRIAMLCEAQRETSEAPSEYLRLFWCLKSSFSVLGRHEAPVQARIREIAS